MRILLLSHPGSVHTFRWAKSLAEKGHSIYVFGLSAFLPGDSITHDDYLKTSVETSWVSRKGLLGFPMAVREVKRLIRQWKPDIVHAHYATSYGLLGRLSGFRPLLISVWGADVFDFPKASPAHRYIFKSNLLSAAGILSTSHIMAKETRKYIPNDKEIEVIPFGIDLKRFRNDQTVLKSGAITIGTVKALFKKYGIDILIQSFYILKTMHPELTLQLVIVGEGNDEANLKALTKELGMADCVFFKGRAPHSSVPEILKSFDIFAALSVDDSESFGVAVVEAEACGLPVVVSDAGGLPEVVEDQVTGIVVPKKDPQRAAEAFERLVVNKELRIQMGNNGRKRVEQYYNWDNNVDQMVAVYKRILTA